MWQTRIFQLHYCHCQPIGSESYTALGEMTQNTGHYAVQSRHHSKGCNNNNIRLLKIDKPQLNTEMLKVKVIHTYKTKGKTPSVTVSKQHSG